ncbi:MAG: tetratricopeptide repeat protein [Candidatus Latescibacterota bacterium]
MPVRLVAALVALALGVSLFLPVPQNLKTHFENGQSFYAIGEYEYAIKEYRKIVKFHHRAVDVAQVTIEISEDLTLPIQQAAWYQLGNSYKKSGEYDEAIECYRNVLKGNVPEGFKATVQYQIAETRFGQEEFGKAATEYGSFVEMFPTSDLVDKAYFYQGWSLFKNEEYNEAVSALRNMLVQYPESKYAADAQFRIASCYFEQDKFEDTVTEAERVLEQYPESASVANAEYLQANSYENLSRYDDAIAAYQDVIDMYDKMFEVLRSSFREGRNVDFEEYNRLFESSFLKIADIHREQKGDYGKAYDTYVAAQETVREYDYKAKLQKLIGDNYLGWKKYDQAVTAYTQVMTNYPNSPYPPMAQYQVGESHYYAGDYDQARREYLALLEKFPDTDTELRAQALYSAGWSSEEMGEIEVALETYHRVLNDYPRSHYAPISMLRVGRAAADKEEYDQALEWFRKVIADYPESGQLNDANYYMGLALKKQGKNREAIEAFGHVGKEAGQFYVASQTSIALLLASEERGDEAEEILMALLQSVAGDQELEPQTHFQIAQVYVTQENYKKAVEHYTVVIDQFPQSEYVKDSYYGRGSASQKLMRLEEAISNFRTLLGLELDSRLELRTKLSLALVYSAMDRAEEARGLLHEVSEGEEPALARAARVQLVSLAEKGDPRKAVEIYNDLLSGASEDQERAIILTRLANVYFKLGRYQEAIDATRTLVQTSDTPEGIASGYCIAGNSYMKMKRYEDAIAEYRQTVDKYPQTMVAPTALFQMGFAYHSLNAEATGAERKATLLSRSIGAFEEFYTKYPDAKEASLARYYSAWGAYQVGSWQKASDSFNALADLFPKSPYAEESQFRAGEALFNMKEYANAYDLYQKVLDRYPKSEWVDDAIYNQAWCFVNQGRNEEAVPFFEQIVANYRDGYYGPRSQFSLGDHYYNLQNYEKATAEYEKFIALFPDHQRVRRAQLLIGELAEIEAYNLYSEGEKLFDQERFREAIAIFVRVREQYPMGSTAVNAMVNIGAAYQAIEDYDRAADEYRALVKQYGDDARFLDQVKFSEDQLKQLIEANVVSMK